MCHKDLRLDVVRTLRVNCCERCVPPRLAFGSDESMCDCLLLKKKQKSRWMGWVDAFDIVATQPIWDLTLSEDESHFICLPIHLRQHISIPLWSTQTHSLTLYWVSCSTRSELAFGLLCVAHQSHPSDEAKVDIWDIRHPIQMHTNTHPSHTCQCFNSYVKSLPYSDAICGICGPQ